MSIIGVVRERKKRDDTPPKTLKNRVVPSSTASPKIVIS